MLSSNNKKARVDADEITRHQNAKKRRRLLNADSLRAIYARYIRNGSFACLPSYAVKQPSTVLAKLLVMHKQSKTFAEWFLRGVDSVQLGERHRRYRRVFLGASRAKHTVSGNTEVAGLLRPHTGLRPLESACRYKNSSEFNAGQSSASVEEIYLGPVRFRDDEWHPLLSKFRRAFPNWNSVHFSIRNNTHVITHPSDGENEEWSANSRAYDKLFLDSMQSLSDVLENYLRHATRPLVIKVDASLLTSGELHVRPEDYPKYKYKVEENVKREDYAENLYYYVRDDDYGEGRRLCMECVVSQTVSESSSMSDDNDE